VIDSRPPGSALLALPQAPWARTAGHPRTQRPVSARRAVSSRSVEIKSLRASEVRRAGDCDVGRGFDIG